MRNSARRLLLLRRGRTGVKFPRASRRAAVSRLSGVVVDSGGGVIPGAIDRRQEQRDRRRHSKSPRMTPACSPFPVSPSAPIPSPSPCRDSRPPSSTTSASSRRTPTSVKAIARNRRAERDGPGQLARRARTEPVDAGVLDARRRAAQRSAAELAQRALRGEHAAGRPVRCRRRPARGRHQRPAEQHRQHHDRRRADRQHAAVDRRLLLDGHAAAGRGRGNHRHRRRAGIRRRPRLGADSVRDPLGHEPVRRQRLPLLAPAEFNSNYYFNKINNLAEERGHRPPVRLPPGRPDRDPGPLRRPQQGVLLLQLRAPVPAARARRARARCCGPKRRPASSATT